MLNTQKKPRTTTKLLFRSLQKCFKKSCLFFQYLLPNIFVYSEESGATLNTFSYIRNES